MPRRRSTKVRSKSANPRPIKRSEGKLKKWEKISDIPLDEEDQFHASRDKVLLDGEEMIDDIGGDENEVFALKGLGDESGDDDEEDEDVQMDYEEIMEETPEPRKKDKKRLKKKLSTKSESEEELESEEETWGKSKSAYYSSNAPQLDSDDDEANELEEQEAKRLQAKSREDLAEADFGLEDALDIGSHEGTDELPENTPIVTTSLPQDKNSIIHHLEKTSPETLALARDWEDTAQNLVDTQVEVAKAKADGTSGFPIQLMHLRYQTLLTYSTTLAFYIYLRTSEKYVQRPDSLRSHPVMGRLLTLKQALATIEEFETGIKLANEDSEDDDFNDLLLGDEDALEELGFDKEELKLLLMDAKYTSSSPPEPPKKKRKTSTKSSKSGRPVEDSVIDEPMFDLVEPEFAPSKSTSSRIDPDSEMTDAYGEAMSLPHGDAVDKKARKKSLRFHTSKIESASARRQGARNQAVGGDDDLPYRERRKEKEDRLAKEAAAKVRGQGGADLDDTVPEPKIGARDGQDDGSSSDGADGPDGYYELVKRKSKERKDQKKTEYEAVQAAARFGDGGQAEVSGPRSLTRAILANKGLTPHRPKAVRNPRVKKRQKFEQAKKKLSSQKAVFKGGLAESGGRYDGEKSGISKVVKSVRL